MLPAVPASADAVVVSGGTVGAWCAYFLRQAGLDQVVLLEKRTLGQGASSRAAGVVRTQGGTSWAVRLGEWSRRFYLSQREELGIDSGFTPQGYLLPCFTEADVTAAHARLAMQNALGLPVRWLEPNEVDRLNPTLAPGLTRGGTFNAEDGYLTPPRNVTAYTIALARSGVTWSKPRQHLSGWPARGAGYVLAIMTPAAGFCASDCCALPWSAPKSNSVSMPSANCCCKPFSARSCARNSPAFWISNACWPR